MKLALIGVGQAGGKIVQRFLRHDQHTGSNVVRSATIINTAIADFHSLNHIPEDNRVLVGQSRVNGHGVGADNELASTIFEEDITEIQGSLDTIPIHEIDAFLIVAALGGGTGSGGGPVIIRNLKHVFTEPVYGLGVLPASDEGGIYTLNAARSLQTFVREADNLLVFDNDAWRQTGESVEGGYEAMNEELVRRLVVLFSAGELSGGLVGDSVVDSSEIINTLAGGGVSSIGYAAEQLPQDAKEGLLSRFSANKEDNSDSATSTNRITSLIRKATLGRLTLPCEPQDIERALVVIGGPPEYLNRKGIERARKWIEEETGSMEIRGGDYPIPDESKVAGVVLLSGVTNVPRIEQLKREAADAQNTMAQIDAEHEENLQGLMDEELDSLF